MSEMLDISDLSKPNLLAHLYGNLGVVPRKNGQLRPGCHVMHVSGASGILQATGGKIGRLGWFRLNIDLSKDTFDSTEYDRINQTTDELRLDRPRTAAHCVAFIRAEEEYLAQQPLTGRQCYAVPPASTRFLQLRLLFGDWYFHGKSEYIQKVRASPKSLPLPYGK